MNDANTGNGNNTPVPSVPMASSLKRVITAGDLSDLSEAEQLEYYVALCRHLDLDPVTTPFALLRLPARTNRDGDETQPARTVLYALKGCTDQLRRKNRISIPEHRITRHESDGVLVVSATAIMPDGREDTDWGVVAVAGKYGRYTGDMLANAYMRAITKAKRRVTLSICGLGILDESEIETIREAQELPAPTVPQAVLQGGTAHTKKLSGRLPIQNAQEAQSPTVPGDSGAEQGNTTTVPQNRVLEPLSVDSLLSRTWNFIETARDKAPKRSAVVDGEANAAAESELRAAFMGVGISDGGADQVIEAVASYLAHRDGGPISTMNVVEARAVKQAAAEMQRDRALTLAVIEAATAGMATTDETPF